MSWPLLPSYLALDHGVPAHEVKEILGHVSLAISSRCTHARLAPDTPPLLILQKPVPSIVADRERLLTFISRRRNEWRRSSPVTIST